MPTPEKHADFVHLRVHSAYSLAEGAIKIPDIVALCREHNMPAVAVTDTGNLFGALEFAMAAAKDGIQPIIGCQLLVGDEVRADQLVLLAQNEAGYQNLIKLSSDAYLETEPGDTPHITWAALEEHTNGVICLTGGMKGPVGQFLLHNQAKEAKNCLKRLQKAFPGRLYVELMRHNLPQEHQIEDKLIDLAYDLDIPLVATNDCFFATRDMHEAHDALLCIADGRYITEDDRRRETPEHYFKTAEEMRELFKDIPEAVDNTITIAKRCSFLLKPIDPILPPYESAQGRTEEEEIRHQSKEGLEWRLENFVEDLTDDLRQKYEERLEHELDCIISMGFAGYFLIVADFIGWAKEHDIPVGPGRGSGGGSLVAWALKIIDLDPIRLNLLFERLLNPERVSMPDFDIDFCQDRRDEVIKYVQDKYGKDHVAHIITFGKLQARAVVRDVGRVLQMPYGWVDKIAKLIPYNPANPMSLRDAIAVEPQLQEQMAAEEQVQKLMDIALKLEGLYRHASTHAAGVVVGDRPLNELIPLYKDPKSDIAVTQFHWKDVEKAGLVKLDFLGLKTLTVIKKACQFIKETTGKDLDPLHFPLEDEKTFKMLASGYTTGVFQLESAGMRDLCKQMKISRFEEIIALVALYRPGPMENIPKYLACLNGQEERDYMHPSLEPVLKETYGVMIYQEQVMQVAQVLAGYTLGGADLLRRAMGKKIQAEMDAQREVFIEGAKNTHGVDKNQASAIFDQVDKFAGYGFNKAHSAGYALVAYQTAYLKANYPVEFMAASMTYDMQNTDKLSVFRQELQKMDIELVPPDINVSEAIFKVGDKKIHYALAALKGVGEAAMEALVAERNANGPYKDLYDFAERLDSKVLNKRQLESMAAAGVFDSLNPNRAQVLASVEGLVKHASAAAADRESGQESLFGGIEEAALPRPPLPDVPDWPPLEKLRHEFEAVGFYLSAHPLDTRAAQLDRLGVVTAVDVPEKLKKSASSRLTMAGVVVRKQERTSAKGNRFAFIQMSDTSGVYEVTVFSELLAMHRELLEAGNTLVIKVDVDTQGDDVRYTVQDIKELDVALAKVGGMVHITVENSGAIDPLKDLLAGEKPGQIQVNLSLVLDGQEVSMSLPGAWALSTEAYASIGALPGIRDVQEVG